MIADARISATSAEIELRNQIDYFGSHCAASTPTTTRSAPTTESARATSPPPSKSSSVAKGAPTQGAKLPVATAAIAKDAPRVSTPSADAPRATAPHANAQRPTSGAARSAWTIQLAAYNTKAEADRMIAKLKGRGVHARISGTAKPFRVRLDYYATRQEAAAAVASLKQRGIIGFVTEESRPAGANGP
jgi:cell division protein FtsN